MPTLSFYDYAFLLTETADSPKHVAGVQIFRPPADYDGDYLSDLIEAMKQRPAGPPFDFKLKGSLLSKPEWVQDDKFDFRIIQIVFNVFRKRHLKVVYTIHASRA